MDRHELELASQYARDFCGRVRERAAKVGFLDGAIIAQRHLGEVTRVKLQMRDPDSDLPDELPLVLPEVGLVRARRMLRATLQEALQPCIVRFGDVTIWFSDGVLDRVWFTEKFRIEQEIPDMARLFVPSLGRARDGHGSRKTRVGGSGRPR